MKLSIGQGYKKYVTFWIKDLSFAQDIYIRRFKNLTLEDETKWLNLRDISEEIIECFGVIVNWA